MEEVSESIIVDKEIPETNGYHALFNADKYSTADYHSNKENRRSNDIKRNERIKKVKGYFY